MLRALLITSLFSVGLVACQATNNAPNVQIENATMRAPLPGQSTAVAYFDIVNTGGEDVLLSASSNISDRVELHNHLRENGVMKMRQVENVEIPGKETVSFKSGGLHIMMFDAEIRDPVTLTLNFKTHDDIMIQIETPAN